MWIVAGVAVIGTLAWCANGIAGFPFLAISRDTAVSSATVEAGHLSHGATHWRVVSAQYRAGSLAIRDTNGNVRFTGPSGPSWVVELSAPVHGEWGRFDAIVVVNAFTGSVDEAQAEASN